jgi:hypothetical protein
MFPENTYQHQCIQNWNGILSLCETSEKETLALHNALFGLNWSWKKSSDITEPTIQQCLDNPASLTDYGLNFLASTTVKRKIAGFHKWKEKYFQDQKSRMLRTIFKGTRVQAQTEKGKLMGGCPERQTTNLADSTNQRTGTDPRVLGGSAVQARPEECTTSTQKVGNAEVEGTHRVWSCRKPERRCVTEMTCGPGVSGLGGVFEAQPAPVTILSKKPQPSQLTLFRHFYNLIINELESPKIKYRQKIEGLYGHVDWEKVDKMATKLSNYSKLKAFLWRSTHGTLWTKKDLKRFKYIDSDHCPLCSTAQTPQTQDKSHLYIECDITRKIFTKFTKEHKIPPLTEPEKLIGFDNRMHRHPLILKKLNILRKYIYDANSHNEKIEWEVYTNLLERIYTIEYSIAAKHGRELKCLKVWQMQDE